MNKIVKLLIAVLLIVCVLVGCTGGSTSNRRNRDADEEDTEQTEEVEKKGKRQFKELASCYEDFSNGDFSIMEEAVPEAYWEYMEDQAREYGDVFDIDDYIEECEEDFEDYTVEEYEERYGKNWKYTVSVYDERKVDKDVLKGIAKLLKDKYDIDKDGVTDAYRLWLHMHIEGKEDLDHSIHSCYAVEIDGEWYLCYVSFDEDDNVSYVEFVFAGR